MKLSELRGHAESLSTYSDCMKNAAESMTMLCALARAYDLGYTEKSAIHAMEWHLNALYWLDAADECYDSLGFAKAVYEISAYGLEA